MKLSLSKTWKVGPLNITLSKSGISLSLGIPGARVGINSKGEVSGRAGVSGFSYNKRKKIFDGVSPSDIIDAVTPTKDSTNE